MKVFYLFLLILTIYISTPINFYSQDSVNIINKKKIILRKNTKYRYPISLYSNKYFRIKLNGQILKDSIKLENRKTSVVPNYCVNILNENGEIIHMKNYGRAHYVYFGDESQLDLDKLYEEKVKKEFEKSLSYEQSLFKHKKKYIKIKVPIRQRRKFSNNTSYDGYGLERGKYYITMYYTNEDKTYHSDTIPLYVR